MILTPEAKQALYASESGLPILAQLTTAYERNLANGNIVHRDSTTAAGAAAIIAAQEAEEDYTYGRDYLANVTSEFKSIAETSYYSSRCLFERIGIDTPNLVEFAKAGFDFARLGDAYQTMNRLNLVPELVIALALPLAGWENIFHDLEKDQTVNSDGRIEYGGLEVDNSIASDWDNLQGQHHSVVVKGKPWQIMVMPADRYSKNVDLTASGCPSIYTDTISTALQENRDAYVPADQHTAEFMHPTIAAYLTLQATKHQAHEMTVDRNTTTWLQGIYEYDTGMKMALVSDSRTLDGKIFLGIEEASKTFNYVGIRMPVWGEAISGGDS
jgi:hypothetical protein